MAVIKSVTSTSNRIDYDPNGIQTVFPFDFEVDNAEWMFVYADGALYESNPFTVSGIGVPAGGEVTFQNPPDDAIVTLTLIREVPMTQEVVYPVYGPFPAKTHEKALDKLTWIVQQLQEELNRALVAPVDGDISELQVPAVNVSFDDSGTTIKGTDVQLWNQASDSYSVALSGEVDTNTEDIIANAENIVINAQGIVDNAGNIDTNTQELATFGNVVTHDVVEDADDVTTTRVLVVGYKGLGTTGALLIPTGDTSERPPVPEEGHYRRNSETGQWEGYTGVFWGPLGGGASGGGSNQVFYENDIHVTDDYTLTTGKNAVSAGPIEVDDGVLVTVPDGQSWTVV